MTMTRRSHYFKGFTLIELIVSVGLFSVVALIAATAYLHLVDIDRRTRTQSDLVNNMTFVMNSMVSNIRTGSGYHCVTSSETSCTTFGFTDSSGCATTYTYSNSGISEAQSGSDSQGNACTNTGELTDPALVITGMNFITTGVNNSPGDYVQPQVIIYLSGSMTAGSGVTSTFNVQTTAVQRGIDLPSS